MVLDMLHCPRMVGYGFLIVHSLTAFKRWAIQLSLHIAGSIGAMGMTIL